MLFVAPPTSAGRRLRQRLAREEGQALLFVAVALVTLLGFVGLTIDAAHAFVNHKQMQTAADSAALAGAWDVVHGAPTLVGADVQKYAHANGYSGPDLTNRKCVAAADTNCWDYPYVDSTGTVHPSSVEVRIHAGVIPFFAAFIHIPFINVHTRAVASLAAGQDVPQYSFVALQSDGENHTLLVKNGSTLNVANSLYTDSCGGMPGCQGGGSPNDSFDVFGSGGTITDAKDINVVGGWETHDGDFVGANGATCLLGAGPYTPNVTLNTGAGGLSVGATTVPIKWGAGADPVSVNDVIQVDNEQMLVNTITAVAGGANLSVTRGYNSTVATTHANGAVVDKLGTVNVAFNPSISTPAGGINATDTTFSVSGATTAVDPGDVIVIDSEQMQVVSVGTSSLTVVRAYNSTTAATHNGGVVIKEATAPTKVAVNADGSAGQPSDPPFIHCPRIARPYLPDPFALFPGPPLGNPAWTGGAPVTITQIKRVSGTATADTANPDGFAVGDPVNVLGVGPDTGFNGTYTVASTPSSTEFTYANPGTNTPSIIGEQVVGGTATVTTNTPFTLTTGSQVTVTGINNIFNVVNQLVSSTGSTSFSFNPNQMSVTNKLLQSGTATLTVNSSSGLGTSGYKVNVANVGSAFNGSQTVATVPNGTTFTFSDPGRTSTLAVTNWSINGTTATLTTATNHVFAGVDQVTVNTGDPRFDGNSPVTPTTGGGTPGGTTLKYTIPAVTATVNNEGAATGTINLTLASFPGFESADIVALPAGLGLAYGSGTVTLTGANSGAKTISYAAAQFNTTNPTTRSGTTVTVTTASAHGLKTGNAVNISGFGGAQACYNVGNTTVTGVPTGTTFTFSVPSTCIPGNGGTGKVTLVTAASTAASGTATLSTTPNISGSGTVTVPLYITSAVSPAGSAAVTDTPATTVAGNFTYGTNGPWMPASGQVGNAKGTSGFPTPDVINTTTTLQPGTYYGGICLGSANGTDCTGADCAAGSGATTKAYSPAVQTNVMPGSINATQTNIPIKWTGAAANPPDPVSNGDTIQIDSEQMAVTNVGSPTYSGGGNKNGAATLTVTRAVNGTTGAMHNNNIAVMKVLPPPSPVTVTLQQGQYIMAGGGFHICGNVSLSAPHVMIYDTNDPSSPGTTYGKVGQVEINTTGTVTLGPQTLDQDPLYAGFTIFEDRSQVVDPPTFTPVAYGAAQSLASSITATDITFKVNGTTPTIYPGNVISIDSELMMVTAVAYGTGFTTVTVTRGYGLTSPASHATGAAVKSVTYGGDTCDNKANKALSGDHTKMDISFLSAGDPPNGFPLDNISGTIYAAGPRADFENAMFGNANLAVIASCIFIDGGSVPPGLPAADFQFNPNGGSALAGVTESLTQ